MTTVGYGDICPKTIVGKFFAMMAALSGAVVISLVVMAVQNVF
jgi:hypothetical protein